MYKLLTVTQITIITIRESKFIDLTTQVINNTTAYL